MSSLAFNYVSVVLTRRCRTRAKVGSLFVFADEGKDGAQLLKGFGKEEFVYDVVLMGFCALNAFFDQADQIRSGLQ